MVPEVRSRFEICRREPYHRAAMAYRYLYPRVVSFTYRTSPIQKQIAIREASMIRRFSLVVLVSSGLLLAQSARQPKLTVHTQVREDIFAGYMGDDMDRFDIGVKKL